MEKIFAELTKEQEQLLETIKIGDLFVLGDDIIEITKTFHLGSYTDSEELRKVRNAVVRFLDTKIEATYHDFETCKQYMNNLSGVTAVIDDRIWSLGGAV